MKGTKKRIAALLAGLGIFLGWFLLPNLAALLGIFLFPEQKDSILLYIGMLGTGLSTLAVAGCFALCGRRFRESTGWYPARVPVSGYLGALAFGICANLAVSVIMSLIPFPEWLLGEYAQQSQALYDPQHGVLSLLSVVVFAPVFEELLFRGYLFRTLRRGFSFWPAAILSALLFGAAHGQLLWILYASGMGLLFAMIAGRSGTVTLSIAAHLGFNLTAVPQLLFPEFFENPAGVLAAGALSAVAAVFLWKRVLFAGVLREKE